MPGKTLVEKVLSHASGREVRAGDITIARVDLAYVQDGTGPLTFRQMEKMGLVKAANPARSVVFIDHSSPPPRKELASDHVYLRDFATKTGMVLSDVGEGVCHQVAFEKYVRPGEVAIGADSHTVMGGAMGVYAKDLILRVIGDIKTDGATYMAMEWGGPAISRMPMTERMVLSNMAIEAGGKCGPQPSDEETRRYL